MPRGHGRNLTARLRTGAGPIRVRWVPPAPTAVPAGPSVVVGPGGTAVSGGGGPGEAAVRVGLDVPAWGVALHEVVVGAVAAQVLLAGGAAVGPGDHVVELGVGGSLAAAGEPAGEVAGPYVVGEP